MKCLLDCKEMFCFVGLQTYLVLKREIVYGACWSRNPAKPIVGYRSSLPSKLSSHQVVLDSNESRFLLPQGIFKKAENLFQMLT